MHVHCASLNFHVHMAGLLGVTSGPVTQWGDGYRQEVNMLHRLKNRLLKVLLGGLAGGKLLREVLAMCCDLNGIH